MARYTQQELRKLFDTLPDELKEAILSEETANTIREICQRNKISQDAMPQVAALIGDILMGVLPPDDFPATLQAELKVEGLKAKRISQEVNRFILYPVKDYLSELYRGLGLVPGGRVVERPGGAEEITPAAGIEREVRKVPSGRKPARADVYREPVE